MSTFVAIDVETANSGRHSICQIGLVAFREGVPIWRWQSLVNPEESFDATNVKVHGITSVHASLAPNFPIALEYIRAAIDGQLLACHTSFDYQAIHAATDKYGLSTPRSTWIDTCEVARLAWPNLEHHKLPILCDHLDIPLLHHDAGSDALACGYILQRAISSLQIDLVALLGKVRPIDHPVEYRPTSSRINRYSEPIELSGRKDGPLAGHVLVCTGEMAMGELKIAQIAAALGCDVEDNVTQKRTTILVTGHRDPAQFKGDPKSGKQIDAEKAIAKGKRITILTENEFLEVAKRFGLTAA